MKKTYKIRNNKSIKYNSKKRRKYKGGNTNLQINEKYWKNIYTNYLKDITFISNSNTLNSNTSNSNELKNDIMTKSFGSDDYFLNLYKNIINILPDNHDKNVWVNCIKDCYVQTHNEVEYEINHSTAYMLRVLTKSVVGDTENNKIVFYITQTKKLTGVWKNDSKYIDMQIQTINNNTILNTSNNTDNINSRLIMGFGPSASGKTYCANKVIELMTSIETNFPKFFMTIDGGIFREEAITYQTILKAIDETKKYKGLNNLVSANFFSNEKTIFNSGIIKRKIQQYLMQQKKKNKLSISLYVPETLGGCIRTVNCMKSYKDYITITGDKNWIGLMIYQHKTHSECIYKEGYKCKGTTESGEEREIMEGKKYSSKAWDNSYKNGNQAINQAKTYRFRIHNSGSSNNVTTFEDLSPTNIDIENSFIFSFFKKNNWQYINSKLKYNIKCNGIMNENKCHE